MGSIPTPGTSRHPRLALSARAGRCYTHPDPMTTTAVEYETIIGLEVHAQLLTRSKMFCPCSTAYADSPPNTHVCPVCLGMPGVLPVINKQAVEIHHHDRPGPQLRDPARRRKFDRKNYPYPDLMKGYQISQYDQPLCPQRLAGDRGGRPAQARRHHPRPPGGGHGQAGARHAARPARRYSLVDVNRSGVPLMEIVSEPDMRSPEEARAYLVKLRQILRYLGSAPATWRRGTSAATPTSASGPWAPASSAARSKSRT